MQNVTASTLNTVFAQKLDSVEGREKLSAAGAAYIRERLRETSFARKIIPPQVVTKADCQRSATHEGLVKIVDIEPKSSAMALNFRSEPDSRYVSVPRFELPFQTISSEKFEKSEQELLSSEMPVTRVIEQNSLKDIQYVEDGGFTKAFRAATQASGKILADAGTGLASKSDLTQLFDLLDDSHLAVGAVLMCKSQLNKWMAFQNTFLGDVLASEVAKDGYRYNTILGHKLLTTIKTNILSPREIAVFAEPDFLGKFYILNNTKFYIDKRFNMIEWMAWEDIGLAFGNIEGMARRVYTGGLPTLTPTTPLTDPMWLDPDELGVLPLDEGPIFAK